ncbi:MAG: response regulator [Thermodesulfobacteriota bacterium]
MLCKGLRLLIVDDDPMIHMAVKIALNRHYSLMFVENAEMAWDLITFFGEPFDLIILDIVLPKMGGIELLKKIREVNAWLPVLVITGYSTHDIAKAACNLKVDGYIEKPFDVDELQEQVRAITGYNKYRDIVLFSNNVPIDKANNLHPIIKRCLKEIHRKFQASLNNDYLALICGVSKQHLCRMFKKDCGMTIREYTTKLRMDAAKNLLRTSSYTVSNIQELVGYKSRTHFFNTFKETTGVSPLEFRNIPNNSSILRS